MQLISKYNENDKVWFYNNHKYYEGIILGINSWNEYDTFVYRIQYDSANESFMLYVNERDIYESESDIPQTELIHYVNIIPDDPEPEDPEPENPSSIPSDPEEPEEPVIDPENNEEE